MVQPWTRISQDVIRELSSRETGLEEREAESRLHKYGKNIFHSKEKSSPISFFLKQFLSPLIFLLIGAGVLTFILTEWADTVVIALAILLNVFLGFYHEYHAENTLDNLKTYIKDRARVIRGGQEKEIEPSVLVPGDIIKLAYGGRVPADARIISANDLRADEAILTGESVPVEKHETVLMADAPVSERKNIVHAGTLVVQGYAKAVVYATGNETEIGKIAGIVSTTKRTETPLQRSVGRLAWLICGIVSVIIFGIFLLGISRGAPLIPMLLLSAAVAVGAVPEALPVALTVILAIGAEHIASKKGIVRKLTAAETLGSTTLVMTDKTGTLTMADMQLISVNETGAILKDQSYSLNVKGFSNEQKYLLELALLNVDVSIENPEQPQNEWIFRGRPFEVNIVKACRAHNIPIDALTALSSRLILPFNSTDKFSVAQNDSNYIVMGAPDILLERSDISEDKYIKMESWINSASREGQRLIGLATMPKKSGELNFSSEYVKDLNFLGMLAFYDPIREGVPLAIKNIESHGIKMVLVTGDLVGTALSVAKSLDWKVQETEVLTGTDLRKMSDEKLLGVIPAIKIFARVTPEDKLRIGKLYQKLGEVVAMTGDGVNDAPSLKAADIGISLGSGSDVAKSAADLVLLDDNFETISRAIDEGRRILSNIRKSFVYLLATSFDEVFIVGGSLLMGLALPLTALQIIWVNLFTGSLPALTFAFDEDMDKERKAGKGARIIFSRSVKVFIFGFGILSSFLLFALYYFLLQIVDIGVARSVLFVCFSSYVLAIAFSFRSLHQPLFSYDIFSNKKLNISILLAFAILVITMAVPAIRNIFELEPLPLHWIPLAALWLVFNILLVEGAKFLLRNIGSPRAKI